MGTVNPLGSGYWIFVALGIFVLKPITRPGLRPWVLAALNLGLIATLVQGGIAIIALGALAAWAWLRLVIPARRSLVAVGIVMPLAMFVFYKRPEWLVAMHLPHATPFHSILLAIGFSYVFLRFIDASRSIADGRRPPPNLPGTINYLLPFHMLAAGPIQSYEDFADQPAIAEPLGAAKSLVAIERICNGLFKKYVIAQFLDEVFLTGYQARGPYSFFEMQVSYLWLYLDFSAYSDIAVGVGCLIGVATPENFNRPLLARNLVEYWERWHITLSLFIRRHVFTPVQLFLVRAVDGTRPLLAASGAFMISFLLCGLWHNLGWRWLGWGATQACGLIVVNLYRNFLMKRLGRKGLNRYLERPWFRAIGVALTFEFNVLALAAATFPFEEYFTWADYPG